MLSDYRTGAIFRRRWQPFIERSTGLAPSQTSSETRNGTLPQSTAQGLYDASDNIQPLRWSSSMRSRKMIEHTHEFGAGPQGSQVEKHNPFHTQAVFLHVVSPWLWTMGSSHPASSRVPSQGLRSWSTSVMIWWVIQPPSSLSSLCLTLCDTSYPSCIPILAHAVSLCSTTHPFITWTRWSNS
jgi:hypothetical protein